MNVLVTGGAGYVGSHVVLALQDAGHDTVVLDDLSSGDVRAIPRYVPLVVGDVGDAETVRKIFADHALDAVVHAAASRDGDDAAPLARYRDNAAATGVLIACCVEAGVRRMVLSSSASVYAPSERPLDEHAPVRPVGAFARSKLVAEWMLEDACLSHGLHGAVIRRFETAGADSYMRSGRRRTETEDGVQAVAGAVVRRRPLDLRGRDRATADGSRVRDYVHVADVAAAHLRALEWLSRGPGFGVFNCGLGRGVSALDLLAAGARLAGRDLEAVDGERRPDDPDRTVASTARSLGILGWSPRHGDLDEILASAVEWERRLAEETGEALGTAGRD